MPAWERSALPGFCSVARQRDERILIVQPFYCAHLLVTRIVAIAKLVLANQVIHALVLIEINLIVLKSRIHFPCQMRR